MTLLSPIGKARYTLQRWILGETETLPRNVKRKPVKQTPSPLEETDSSEERITQFMEELAASSQEWLGRVRTINFDWIRERVGPTWPKLQDRVEILAEKIIQEEMTRRDRYLKASKAEFLVFFADATPEESRIRCFAIVEAIHEKLFGSVQSESAAEHRVAECHVIHRDDLVSRWAAAGSLNRSAPCGRPVEKLAGGSFRHDAEILDEADLAASTQIVIDSIISQGTESRSMAEFPSLLVRLQILSRNLKTLEPALKARRKFNSQSGFLIDSAFASEGDEACENSGDAIKPLGTVWDDLADLTSTLDAGPDQSHADLLAAIGELRRARLARAAKTLADCDISSARCDLVHAPPMQFEYVPVYRSTARGDHIHQGIYRVSCKVGKPQNSTLEDDLPGQVHRKSMAVERAVLEHAIQHLLDHKTSASFMLMTSVHVETLRSPKSQMQHSMILRSARLRAKKRLLIEVIGYSDRDDTIGIQRAIDELRVHSHAVFISLSQKGAGSIEKIAMECKRFGVHAFGFDASQFSGGNGEIMSAITRLASLGARHSVPTFVDGIRNVPVLAKAIAAGICYVCAPVLRPPLSMPGEAGRTTLNDLYSAI